MHLRIRKLKVHAPRVNCFIKCADEQRFAEMRLTQVKGTLSPITFYQEDHGFSIQYQRLSTYTEELICTPLIYPDHKLSYDSEGRLEEESKDYTFSIVTDCGNRECCIYLRKLNGTVYANYVTLRFTIAELKKMHFEDYFVPQSEQIISYMGVELDDKKTLAEYEVITDQCTLDLQYKSREQPY